MTELTVTNVSGAVQTLPRIDNTSCVLKNGDCKTIKMHPHAAGLVVRESVKPRPKFEVDMDDEERVAMEQAIEAGRRAIGPTGPRMFPVDQAPTSEEARRRLAVNDGSKKDTRFITDPKTVPDTKKKAPAAKVNETDSAPKKKKSGSKTSRVALRR